MRTFETAIAAERSEVQRPAATERGTWARRETLAGLGTGPGKAMTPEGIGYLQRTAGNAEVSRLVAEEEDPFGLVNEAVASPGEALNPDVQRTMEHALGADLSDVRIHRDGKASDSAQTLNAQAYTVGSHVVVPEGGYDPASHDGQRMLAHELTHVVQQREGPVDGTPVGDSGLSVSDPSDPFEQAAERTAEQVMASGALQRTAAPEGDPAESVPRAEVDDEDGALQAMAQRQTDEEEDEEE